MVLIGAALLLASPAKAQSTVSIIDAPRISEVLPANQIIIRNASGSRLSFWISVNDDAWSPYFADPGKAALIKSPNVRAAIATTRTEAEQALAAKAPLRPPTAVVAGYHVEPPFFFARLAGGSRAQFCWSPSEERWRIQMFGEAFCD